MAKSKTFVDSKGTTTTDFKKRSERQEQVALFKNIKSYENTYPELRLLFAIPNGGKRSPQYGAMMKAQGLKSGVPDCFLPVPKQIDNDGTSFYNGLFIEMKVGKNKLSENQEWWRRELHIQGYLVKVCYSEVQALGCILEYVKS